MHYFQFFLELQYSKRARNRQTVSQHLENECASVSSTRKSLHKSARPHLLRHAERVQSDEQQYKRGDSTAWRNMCQATAHQIDASGQKGESQSDIELDKQVSGSRDGRREFHTASSRRRSFGLPEEYTGGTRARGLVHHVHHSEQAGAFHYQRSAQDIRCRVRVHASHDKS